MSSDRRSTRDTSTFSAYVAAHPTSQVLLDALREVFAGIGPVEEVVTTSQVAFRRDRPVAWAWAPGQYRRGAGAPLVLTFDLPERDVSPRWKEVVEVRPGHFTHHLELFDDADLDDEVRTWLRDRWVAAGE